METAAAATGGPGRDAFVYYASAENGADVITDFDNADGIIALHGFAKADVTVRAEGSATVIDLPGPDQITLRDGIRSRRDPLRHHGYRTVMPRVQAGSS